ncbi:MAG: MarC family NAAT transporter [Phycisphaerales bacterium]|nr:MarC family NAAT transporter [Phycisphaerales bacterium]
MFELFLGAFVSLFVITDPFGNVGIFLSITDGDDAKFRKRQAFKGNLYALVLLLAFLFGGTYILEFFGITLNAVNLGGGLVVGYVGWGLLHPKEKRKHTDKEEKESKAATDISFCPLALPLIAGPGAIAVVISQGAKLTDPNSIRHLTAHGMKLWEGWVAVAGAVVVAMFVSWICLRSSGLVLKALGTTGMNALTRIMGFLLVCIAAQMMISGTDGVVRDIVQANDAHVDAAHVHDK